MTPAKITDEAVEAAAVTRDEAIAFLECACRNWTPIPKLFDDEIDDVAAELTRFAAKRALPHLPRVSVKALEWQSKRLTDDNDWAQDADTSIGRYISTSAGWFLMSQTPWNEAGSFDEAKAAAQADYERRILLALSFPAPGAGITQEAADAWMTGKGPDPRTIATPAADVPNRGPRHAAIGNAVDGGCQCQRCGVRYRGDLLVPDDVWSQVNHGQELLCPTCIMNEVVDRGLWTAGVASNIDTTAPDAAEELEVVGQQGLGATQLYKGLFPHPAEPIVRQSDAQAIIEKLRAENAELKAALDSDPHGEGLWRFWNEKASQIGQSLTRANAEIERLTRERDAGRRAFFNMAIPAGNADSAIRELRARAEASEARLAEAMEALKFIAVGKMSASDAAYVALSTLNGAKP